jgi:hypothetical protein
MDDLGTATVLAVYAILSYLHDLFLPERLYSLAEKSITSWPLATVLIVFLLKSHFGKLFSLLKQVRYKDNSREISADFADSMDELVKFSAKIAEEKDNNDVSPPDDEEEKDQQQYSSKLHELASVSPRSAIIEAWIDVETIASELLHTHQETIHQQDIKRRHIPVIERELWKSELISPEEREMMFKLRDLRNKASHLKDFELSEGEALNYIDIAQWLSSALKYRLKQQYGT